MGLGLETWLRLLGRIKIWAKRRMGIVNNIKMNPIMDAEYRSDVLILLKRLHVNTSRLRVATAPKSEMAYKKAMSIAKTTADRMFGHTLTRNR